MRRRFLFENFNKQALNIRNILGFRCGPFGNTFTAGSFKAGQGEFEDPLQEK